MQVNIFYRPKKMAVLIVMGLVAWLTLKRSAAEGKIKVISSQLALSQGIQVRLGLLLVLVCFPSFPFFLFSVLRMEFRALFIQVSAVPLSYGCSSRFLSPRGLAVYGQQHFTTSCSLGWGSFSSVKKTCLKIRRTQTASNDPSSNLTNCQLC